MFKLSFAVKYLVLLLFLKWRRIVGQRKVFHYFVGWCVLSLCHYLTFHVTTAESSKIQCPLAQRYIFLFILSTFTRSWKVFKRESFSLGLDDEQKVMSLFIPFNNSLFTMYTNFASNRANYFNVQNSTRVSHHTWVEI